MYSVVCLTEVSCISCNSTNIRKCGINRHGDQSCLCLNPCGTIKSFMLKYRYKACIPCVQKQVGDMAIHGSGNRDTSRVLQTSKTTTINIIRRKEANLIEVNPNIRTLELSVDNEVRLEPVCKAAELMVICRQDVESTLALVCSRPCDQHCSCLRFWQKKHTENRA